MPYYVKIEDSEDLVGPFRRKRYARVYGEHLEYLEYGIVCIPDADWSVELDHLDQFVEMLNEN